VSAPDQDVLVVGAGIQGVGVAQAACAAGYRVLLLEERNVAFGTSSRSSKLIHGGLRYLESGQFALVRESLSERAVLLEIAPQLVKLVPFYIPIYDDTTRRAWEIRAGLSLYAALGGFVAEARFARIPRKQWDDLDGLRTDGLRAVFRYHDGQTDDAALTRAVLASARELGCEVRCPAEFLAAERSGEHYQVRYRSEGEERTCTTRCLVNAAGPWIDAVQARITPEPTRPNVELVAGAHVVYEGALKGRIYYTEAPSDRRAVFVMPWKGAIMVGTTETPYQGPPEDVRPTPAELDYLGATMDHYFPAKRGTRIDAFAGLRVLPKGRGKAFDRPRDVTLAYDDEHCPHLVAIYGGKLTGYRATAQKVMERLARTLPPSERKADTETLVLPRS
jgi:glycerol-3-phosphate dehydrogenase